MCVHRVLVVLCEWLTSTSRPPLHTLFTLTVFITSITFSIYIKASSNTTVCGRDGVKVIDDEKKKKKKKKKREKNAKMEGEREGMGENEEKRGNK